jgi:hypothetical protein
MKKKQVVAGALAVGLVTAAGCAEFDPGDGYEFPKEPVVTKLPDRAQWNTEGTRQLVMPDDPEPAEIEASRTLLVPEGGRLEVPPLRIDALGHDFTLELWLKFDDDRDQLAISMPALELWQRNRTLQLEILGTQLTGVPLASPEWYHVAIVVAQDRVKLYVNGQLTDREMVGQPWTWAADEPLVVGQRPGSTATFRGRVDDMRVVAAPLHEQPYFDVPTALESADHTVFGYDFDAEKPGEIIIDVAGRGVDATLHSGARTVAGRI